MAKIHAVCLGRSYIWGLALRRRKRGIKLLLCSRVQLGQVGTSDPRFLQRSLHSLLHRPYCSLVISFSFPPSVFPTPLPTPRHPLSRQPISLHSFAVPVCPSVSTCLVFSLRIVRVMREFGRHPLYINTLAESS